MFKGLWKFLDAAWDYIWKASFILAGVSWIVALATVLSNASLWTTLAWVVVALIFGGIGRDAQMGVNIVRRWAGVPATK